MIKSGLNSIPRPKYAGSAVPSGPASTALLHFDGLNGGTTFTDVKGHSFTIQGGTPTTDTSLFKFGTASLTGPASAANWIGSAANSDWNLTADFTIDMWVYMPDVAHNHDFMGCSNFGIGAETNADFFLYRSGFHRAGTPVATTWTHVALVRSGTSVHLYINGASILNITDSNPFGDAATVLGIMYFPNIGYGCNSQHVDEFRLINGTAAWTSNFTPPTSPYSN